jgi:hypothetical protein
VYAGSALLYHVHNVRTFAGTRVFLMVARMDHAVLRHAQRVEQSDAFELTRSLFGGQNKLELVSKITGERVTLQGMMSSNGMVGTAKIDGLHGLPQLLLAFNHGPHVHQPPRFSATLKVAATQQQVASIDSMANNVQLSGDIDATTAIGLLLAAKLLGMAL